MGVRDSSEGTGPSVVGTDPRLGGWSMGIGSSLGTGPKSGGSEGTDPCVVVCEGDESADSGDSSSIISK